MMEIKGKVNTALCCANTIEDERENDNTSLEFYLDQNRHGMIYSSKIKAHTAITMIIQNWG